MSEIEQSKNSIIQLIEKMKTDHPGLNYQRCQGKRENCIWILNSEKYICEVWATRDNYILYTNFLSPKEKKLSVDAESWGLSYVADQDGRNTIFNSHLKHAGKDETNVERSIKQNRGSFFYSKALFSIEEVEESIERILLISNDILGQNDTVVTDSNNYLNQRKKTMKNKQYDKNLILYGPPGTGKTYNTINYAVAICEGKSFEEVQSESYDEVLNRFDALKRAGRISFTTFHQSYGYEEFIEGIKPVTDEESGSISYEITNGIFKDFCEKAEIPQNIRVNHEAQVYIVRLKGNGDNELKKECFRDGEIRFDWPKDYSDGWMKWFSAMKPGDYVMSYYGQSRNVDAIGVIQDEEPLYDESKGSYKWVRKVEWLVTGRIIDILEANNGKYLSNFHVGRVPEMKLSSLLSLIGGGNIGTNVVFENAWNKLTKVAEDNNNKYTFTRRTGSTIDAEYNGNDSFKVEWSGGSFNYLKKKDIYEQWIDTELSADDIPNGGNKWLYYARQAVLDEMSRFGLPGYSGTPSGSLDACVFIIDEINRGNISKIFGELITLIEDTKRKGCPEAATAVLPYSHVEFSVPQNVYILGTMNTADRSIALMDTALRRRFSFIEMMPNSEVLDSLGVGMITDGVQELDVSEMLRVINRRIEYLYDREHTIGHAFFTKLKNNPSIETLAAIFKKNVIPLLQEYFYEDYAKIQYVLGDNQKETSLKFILDEGVDMKDIFNGVPDIDLPEKKYRIQESAFYNIDSYKGIGKNL